MTITALVSTYKSLLLVQVDTDARTVAVTPVDTDKGIYFGLTRQGPDVLVAARNRDNARRQGSAAHATDAIYRVDPTTGTLTPAIVHPCLTDLHQIRRFGNRLFVILGTGSELAIFDVNSYELLQRVPLAPLVPPHLRRADSKHPDDPYHFNSLATDGHRLLVLAHNWDRGSFALDLEMNGPDFEFRETHEGLGYAAHDIVLADHRLHVLDGQAGALIGRGDTERTHDIPHLHGAPFPRGLSLTADHILVGYGSWSAEPFVRLRSPTRLLVLRRDNWQVVMDGELGTHGNPTDILVLSEPDASDPGINV